MSIKKDFFVFACSFFFCLGLNILGFSLIFRLTDWFSFSPGQIGAFIALGNLFYFLGCNLYHRFGSAFHPVKVFSVSAILVFFLSIPLGFAKTTGIVYVSYWILNLCTGLYWPPLMAWLTSGLGRYELNRKIGIYNRTWMSGTILGPLISGGLYQWNIRVNFLVHSFCYLLVLLLLFLMKRYSAKEASVSDEILSSEPEHSIETMPENLSSERPFDKGLDLYRYQGWINALCSSLFVGVLVNVVPLHIRDGMGYTEQSAGIILFLRGVMGFIGFTILARFTAWHFNRRWFIILHFGLFACTLFLMLAGQWFFFYFIIVILFGFIYSACYNNSMFYSSATGGNTKKNLALHEIFLCIGNATGTIMGGFLYQHFRFIGICIALFIVLSIGLGTLIFIERMDSRISIRSSRLTK